MIFKNGLDDIIKENRDVSGGYEIPDEMRSLRGDVAFTKILGDAIKGKEINTREDFLEEVKKAWERLTGVEFSLERTVENEKAGYGKNENPQRGFSQEIYDSDPWEEGASWGWIDLTNWLGDNPKALDFIARTYHLQ